MDEDDNRIYWRGLEPWSLEGMGEAVRFMHELNQGDEGAGDFPSRFFALLNFLKTKNHSRETIKNHGWRLQVVAMFVEDHRKALIADGWMRMPADHSTGHVEVSPYLVHALAVLPFSEPIIGDGPAHRFAYAEVIQEAMVRKMRRGDGPVVESADWESFPAPDPDDLPRVIEPEDDDEGPAPKRH